MKKISFFLFIILTLLLFASCTTKQNTNTNPSESPTKEPEVVASKPALILDDYSDYFLYREGKLEVEDYYYECFGTDQKVFIDIRALLEFPELPESGYKEQIAILSNKKFMYDVYSVGGKGQNTRIGFSVIVSYEEDETEDISNIPVFDSIKANTDNASRFYIRKGENILRYSQNNQIYTYVKACFEKYTFKFFFDGTGWTPAQIEEKCGKLVASLVSENDEELSGGVKTIATALGQES